MDSLASKLDSKKIRRVNIFYKLFIALICIQSFGAWFFAGIESTIIHVIAFVVFLLLFILFPRYYRFEKKSTIWFLLLFVAVFFTTLRSNLVGALDTLLSIMPLLLIFSLKSELKNEVLEFVLLFLGICLSISLTFFILHIVGIPLPHFYQTIGHYDFDIYYSFVVGIDILEMILPLPRFHFVFYEPGYTGCLISLLLFVFRYNFRKYKILIVYLIALLFTLSLAGYLLTGLGFFISRFKSIKRKFAWIIGIITFFVFAIYFFRSYNGGDNIINMAILQRLEFNDDSEGLIAGYNRSSESFRDYFWNDFIRSDQAWLGRPDHKSFFEDELFNIDWTAYVVSYGWIGLITFLIFAFYPSFTNRNHRFDFLVFSVLFVLIFSQTIALIYSYMYMTVYSLGFNRLKTIDS